VAPSIANGKICYVEIPATDMDHSAAFYQKVFGWNIRQRSDGHTAFDHTVGEVSGGRVLGRSPSPNPGLLLYVLVDSVEETLGSVIAEGGVVIQPIGGDAPEITARFSDPAGNVIGLHREPSE
jgi:hypothetical protein